MTSPRQKQEGKRRIPRGFVFPGPPSEFGKFLPVRKPKRGGLISAIWINGKRWTVAELLKKEGAKG